MIVRETGEQPETQRNYHNKSESSRVHEKGWYSSSNYKLDKYQGFFQKKILNIIIMYINSMQSLATIYIN